MRSEDEVDWHPGSGEQVRDIVHPSMYCYVKGKSHFNTNVVDNTAHQESERYQWLPSEINISKEGQVKFNSYINNLHRPELVPILEDTLTAFVPSFEKVLRTQLKGRSAQVIVKIGSIHLDQTKPKYPGGSWHIEGMPYERIVATGLHYLETEGISDSFLEFRKPAILNEDNLDYPQSDTDYTDYHYGVEHHHDDGKMNRYLGLIKAAEGSSVIFPNTLQHHVREFHMTSEEPGLRTIVAFFLVDPDQPIISTKDIPPQYKVFTLDEARQYRQELMYHRKFFVDRLNKKVYERPYSLCEH